jgi:cytochrome c oxidase assembly factor CtaG
LGLGLLAALVAVEGPLDRAAETSEAWHMGQHVLLLSVAAPLLVLGAPRHVMSAIAPDAWRHRVRRLWARAGASAASAWLVALGIVAQGAAIAAWHLPSPYQAAVRNPGVHVLEHLTYLASGALFWWAMIRVSRVRLGAGVLALFVAALPATALGLLMTLARTPWYPVYGTGSAALVDQQVAGVVMWAIGNTVYAIGAVALFAAWLASLERATPARPLNARS